MCVFWRSGWGVTQAENLAWTNENYAYGINLYNRHGGLYTLMGGWYEWVPPAVDFYQPYWKYWKSFTDYVKRLSYILSQGKHRADVALLYPLTTMHAKWVAERLSGPLTHDDLWPAFEPAANQSAQSLMKLAKSIYHHGIDLDFINDESIEQATIQDNKLEVADLEFRAIVLPPLTTIRTATLEKVKTLYDRGGTVVAFGQLPNASAEHGRGDPHIRSLVRHVFGIQAGRPVAQVTRNYSQKGGVAVFVPKEETQVPAALSQAITRDVVASEEKVFHTHQKVGDLEVYFLFNAKPERRRLSFRFRLNGEPEIWDAFTGSVYPVHRFKRETDTTQVELEMEPYAGVVLVFTPHNSRPEVTYSHGPYWWHIGPFQERANGSEAHLSRVERLKRGDIHPDKPWPRGEIGQGPLRWQPYHFSQKFGYPGDVHHADSGLAGVSENFFVFEASHDVSKPTHFLFTHVYAPEETVATLQLGRKAEKSEYRSSPGFDPPRRQQAWVNGEEVLSFTQGQNIWNVADLHKKGFQFDLGQGSSGREAGPAAIQASVRLNKGCWNWAMPGPWPKSSSTTGRPEFEWPLPFDSTSATWSGKEKTGFKSKWPIPWPIT